MAFLRVGLLITLAVASANCSPANTGGSSDAIGSDAPSVDPTEMWAEPTHIPTENCEGCEEIALGTLGHGGDGTFRVDRQSDDVISQWAKCLHNYMDCVDADGAMDDCVANSICPGLCKSEYARLSAGSGDDIRAKYAALNAVFFNEGAPCKPEQVPSREELTATGVTP